MTSLLVYTKRRWRRSSHGLPDPMFNGSLLASVCRESISLQPRQVMFGGLSYLGPLSRQSLRPMMWTSSLSWMTNLTIPRQRAKRDYCSNMEPLSHISVPVCFGFAALPLIMEKMLQSPIGKSSVMEVSVALLKLYRANPMIENDTELQVTRDRIKRLQDQIAHLRRTESNAANFHASVSGFIAEMDRMHLEIREYLMVHPNEVTVVE